MKSYLGLSLILLTLTLPAFSQNYEAELAEQEMMQEPASEIPMHYDEQSSAYAPGEIERQEDMQYPEGEERDWSLGSEDYPIEDYQE